MSRDESVAIPYEDKLHNTGDGGATQYAFPDIDEPVWIPNSQIEDDDEDEREVTIPVWLAEDKGLI
jgi:hypothetical protein